MTVDPLTAPDSSSVAELVDDYMMRSRGSAFPLTGSDGRVTGLVTLSRCKTVPPEQRGRVAVRDIADPLDQVTTARPDELVLDVLQRVIRQPDRILVFDDGELAGIVTPTDVMRIVRRAPLLTGEPARGAA
jgi:CBS domain-containing protein